jgi:aminoglycoside phosphotransferase (APT) family kinase protein
MNDTKTRQLEKFKRAAVELNCDQSVDALDRAFKSVDAKAPPTPKKKPKKK